MGISTVDKGKETVVDKKENLKKLREFHKATLDRIGVPVEYLTGKMAYRPYGRAEVYVSFFDNEINKGHDIFLEFTNRRLDEIDEKGTFKSDDEIGWFFESVKTLQNELDDFNLNGVRR